MWSGTRDARLDARYHFCNKSIESSLLIGVEDGQHGFHPLLGTLFAGFKRLTTSGRAIRTTLRSDRSSALTSSPLSTSLSMIVVADGEAMRSMRAISRIEGLLRSAAADSTAVSMNDEAAGDLAQKIRSRAKRKKAKTLAAGVSCFSVKAGKGID